MARKVMGVIREFGDNIRHDKWYRETMYAPEDREVMLLLVLGYHMTDEELYKEMRSMEYDIWCRLIIPNIGTESEWESQAKLMQGGRI